MLWMAERAGERASPRGLWPQVRSVVMLGMSYAPALDPRRHADHPQLGVISVYAQGADYHDVIKKRLKQLARWLLEAAIPAGRGPADVPAGRGPADVPPGRGPADVPPGRGPADVKVFVDTAPVMEKPLAAAAGLGWQGKHTNLVSRTHGSWLFLGAIYTTLDLEADAPHADRCGSCTACQTACPTDAFPAPYQLDARRCVSYLTIEHKGPIPRELRAALGNRVYGCDDCLAACPWNKFAAAAREMAFSPRLELTAPRLAELLALDDAGFRQVFAGSPIKRIGRDRLVRNALIAAGNSAAPALLPAVLACVDDPAPVVRGAAAWAVRRLAEPMQLAAVRRDRLARETDDSVRAEWD